MKTTNKWFFLDGPDELVVRPDHIMAWYDPDEVVVGRNHRMSGMVMLSELLNRITGMLMLIAC